MGVNEAIDVDASGEVLFDLESNFFETVKIKCLFYHGCLPTSSAMLESCIPSANYLRDI